MKTIIILSLFLSPYLNRPIVKTLVKSFQYHGERTVELDLPGEVKVIPWDEPHIRIEQRIEVESNDSKLISVLIRGGRYSLQSLSRNGVLQLYIPRKRLQIRGVDFKEKISYVIQLPRQAEVKNLNGEIITSDLRKY